MPSSLMKGGNAFRIFLCFFKENFQISHIFCTFFFQPALAHSPTPRSLVVGFPRGCSPARTPELWASSEGVCVAQARGAHGTPSPRMSHSLTRVDTPPTALPQAVPRVLFTALHGRAASQEGDGLRQFGCRCPQEVVTFGP